MFRSIYIITLLIILNTGCDVNADSNKYPQLEGVYVKYATNEFSITWDTIYISVISKKSGTYFINHKAGYHRIRNGRLQDKEHKETGLIGSWMEESRQLKTENLGRVYSFPEDSKSLLMGTVPYSKIH